MDAVLLQSIQQESAERKAADDALRSAVTETSIVGSYAFTGTVLCLTSSNGFTADFTPTAPIPGGPSTVTTVFNGVSSGVRTFNEGGAGTGTGCTIGKEARGRGPALRACPGSRRAERWRRR